MFNVILKNNDNKIKKLKIKKKKFSICISFVFKKFGNKKNTKK